MHALHKILVYIPEVVSNPENYTREELIKEIRNYAVMNTEQFYFSVFDYRETETAGRWQSRYPLNVLFAKDNKTRFLQELSTTKDSQHERILDNLSHLKEMVGTDLVEIILENLPYEHIRWIENENIDLDHVSGTSDMKKIKDLKDRPLLLFVHEWSIRMTQERNDGLILSEFGRS